MKRKKTTNWFEKFKAEAKISLFTLVENDHRDWVFESLYHRLSGSEGGLQISEIECLNLDNRVFESR